MAGDAVAWTRDTPWRQGHVLTVEAVKTLGLVHTGGLESACVVVVSHDCDLANDDLDAEPQVEVIVGCIPAKPNGNFSWAKSPRTLHFEIERSGTSVLVELVATFKALVPKEALGFYEPNPDWSMSGQSLATLRAWLAVRYNRVAFPDAFVERLRDCKITNALQKLVEPNHKSLSHIFFDVDGGRELDRTDGGAYELKIVLVYPPGDDPEETADEIDKLAESIKGLFEKRCYNSDSEAWAGIHLKSCIAISEDSLPVSKAKLMNEWRFEHMSLKDRIQSCRRPRPPASAPSLRSAQSAICALQRSFWHSYDCSSGCVPWVTEASRTPVSQNLPGEQPIETPHLGISRASDTLLLVSSGIMRTTCRMV